MNGLDHLSIPFVATNKQLAEIFLHSVKPAMRILIVVDSEIAFEPGAGFGLSHLIDLLNSPPTWTRFQLRSTLDVDLARRGLGNPAVNCNAQRYEPTYENFSFVMEGFNLDQYDQVWLFGFWGESHPGVLAAAEVAALSAWMNNGGGVFATGDHGTLGAALCQDVPRVRTMRRWAASQNPPPQHGPARHVTTQPATIEQGSGYDVIPINNERDAIPQPISPTKWFLRYEADEQGRFMRVDMVHPLLCGIEGPIIVLPDHPHEGEVVDFVDIDAAGEMEYPSMNGMRPRPVVVAFARSGPPSWSAAHVQYEGGEVYEKTFAAIGAYDGQRIGIGRVVVDSSLQHWLDQNLQGLAQGDLAKIQTYYLNVVVWLAKPEQRWWLATGALLTAVLAYPGVVDVHQRTPDLHAIGSATRDVLRIFLPDCEITNLVMDPNGAKDPPVLDERKIEPIPEGCLSCPPWEELEAYSIGGMVEAVREVIAGYENGQKIEDFNTAKVQKDVEVAMFEGAARGRKKFVADLRTSLKIAEALADFVDKLDQ